MKGIIPVIVGIVAAAGVFAGVGAYQQYQFAQFERALNASSQQYIQALNNQTQQYQQGFSRAQQQPSTNPLAGARVQPPGPSSQVAPTSSGTAPQYSPPQAPNGRTHRHEPAQNYQAQQYGGSATAPQPYVPSQAGSQAYQQSTAPSTNAYSYSYNYSLPSSPYNTPAQDGYYYYSPPPNRYYSSPGGYYYGAPSHSYYYNSAPNGYYYGTPSYYYSGTAPTNNYSYTEPTGNFFDSAPVPYSRWQDRDRNFGITFLPNWPRNGGSTPAPIVDHTQPRFGIGGTQDFRSRRSVQWMQDGRR